MPLVVTVQKEVVLSDLWVTKEQWEQDMKKRPSELSRLLEEDISSFIEECGGAEGLVRTAAWRDPVVDKPCAEHAPNEGGPRAGTMCMVCGKALDPKTGDAIVR